jgi:hypothetical protein
MCVTEIGREDEARAQLSALARDDFRGIHRDGNWLASMAATCMAATGLGDATRAALIAELLEPYADRWVVGTAGAICMGPVSLYLGMAESTAGWPQRAAPHLEQALTEAERLGGRSIVVYARHEYGTLLLASDDEAERRRGAEMLTEALAEARALGLTRFAERILALDAAG